MASLSQKPRLFLSFWKLLSNFNIIGHTEYYEKRLKKKWIIEVDLTKRLWKNPNIWNLAVIDNIDFKEKTFKYDNIFDTTRNSSHTTLRIVFQIKMLISLDKKPNDEKTITSLTELFDMNNMIRDMLDIFDKIVDDLLDFYINESGQFFYNKNFDMTTIYHKILERIEHECFKNSSNIIILDVEGTPNSDEGIF